MSLKNEAPLLDDPKALDDPSIGQTARRYIHAHPELQAYLSEVRPKDPNRQFSQDPLSDYERDVAWSINPYFKDALSKKRDLTEAFIGTLYQRLVASRKNYIMTIKGPMGFGKSVAAMGIYKLIRDIMGLEYNASHVLFTEEDLKNADIKKRDTLIVDEDFKFGYGIGLTSLNNFVDFLNQTIRYEQVNIIYVGPDQVQSVAHRHLEIIDYDTETYISRLLVKPSNEWAGMQYIGNVRIKGWVIPGYEKRKAEFTKKVMLDSVRSHNSSLDLIADALVKKGYLELSQRALKGVIRMEHGSLSEKQIDAVMDIMIAKKALEDHNRGKKPGKPTNEDDADEPTDDEKPPAGAEKAVKKKLSKAPRESKIVGWDKPVEGRKVA